MQVYFKCNRNFIHEMPNLKNYVRELYSMPAIARAVNIYHIKVGVPDAPCPDAASSDSLPTSCASPDDLLIQ